MKTETEEAAEWLNAGTWGATDPESEPQTPLGKLAKQKCLASRASLEKGLSEARRANRAEDALARQKAEFEEFQKLAERCLFLDMRRDHREPDLRAICIEFDTTRVRHSKGGEYLDRVFADFKFRCLAELRKQGL